MNCLDENHKIHKNATYAEPDVPIMKSPPEREINWISVNTNHIWYLWMTFDLVLIVDIFGHINRWAQIDVEYLYCSLNIWSVLLISRIDSLCIKSLLILKLTKARVLENNFSIFFYFTYFHFFSPLSQRAIFSQNYWKHIKIIVLSWYWI